MFRTTSHQRKRFSVNTFVFHKRKAVLLPFFLILPCLLCLGKWLKPWLRACSDSEGFLSLVHIAMPLFRNDSAHFSPPNRYDILNAVYPMIPANSATAKKYAAKYNSSIRAKRSASQTENQEKTETLQNKTVQTLNMAAKGLSFNNATTYALNADELLAAPLSFGSRRNEARVLIVHTHTSEAYFDSPNGRSTNPQENVVRVGSEIAETLRQKGVVSIHDTTKNDEPDYNGSYKKALGVIQQNLLQHPSVEIVLDIHRDYTVRDSGTPSELYLKPTQTQNGKDAAQIMFVMGTDAMDLYHPNWRHNLSFAVKIQNKMNQLHPELCRPINLRIERFNQHMTKGSMIIEVGSSTNTLEEAIRAGGYIGEAIAAVLNETDPQ